MIVAVFECVRGVKSGNTDKLEINELSATVTQEKSRKIKEHESKNAEKRSNQRKVMKRKNIFMFMGNMTNSDRQ